MLLERTSDGGRKILISGGGRCNILPSLAQPERYVTDSSPNALRRILRSWPLEEQRTFFEGELGIQLALEEESGKLFPASNRASEVRDGLVQGVREAGARLWFGATVADVAQPVAAGAPWAVTIEGAPPLEAAAVVLATGGLSVPATGSDGTGLSVASKLGHHIRPTYPALTPLLAEPAVHSALAGISLDVTLQAPGERPRFSTTGGFLFTHRGYSGPAVLDASHLAVRSKLQDGAPQALTVRWGKHDFEGWEKALIEARGPVGSLVTRELPARLAHRIITDSGVDPTDSLARLEKGHRRRLAALLADYPLPWTGDEGYKKAEVTGGGLDLAEVDPNTLESRRHPGLFLCGEMLDAYGPIGGYNFQWAWATGRAAGRAAARRA